MPSLTDLRTAMGALQEFLQDALDAEPFATAFALFGGVRVVMADVEPRDEIQAGSPVVVLSGTDAPATSWGRSYRAASITIEVKASEFAGAIVGQGLEDIPAQTAISQAVSGALLGGYAALRDLGLLGSNFSTGVARDIVSADSPTVHSVEHTLTCYFAA